MKRLISILLIVCLLPALLAVPAMGAEASPASVYDLLPAADYQITDNNGNAQSSTSPSGWFSNILSVDFVWEHTVSFTLERVYLGVKATTQPSDVQIWSGGKYVSCEMTSCANSIYYYAFDNMTAMADYKVRVKFDSWYTGTLAVTSFYGFVDNAIEVSSCKYFTNVVIASPTSGWSEHIVNDSGTALLPVASHWNGPYDYIQEEFMDYAECYYKVSAPIDYAQSVSWLVYAVGDIGNVGVRLEKSDGNILYAVPSVVEPCGDSQIVVNLSAYSHRLKTYQITADLQGYDLSDCVVTLSYEVEPVAFDTAIPYFWGFYSQLTACSFLPMGAPQGAIDRFIGWIKPHLNDIEGSLEEIAGAMQATEPGSEEYGDKMQEASDRMNNAASAMDSVSRPGPDSINTNISGLVDSSSAALAISPLRSIFSSSTLFPVFLIAFSLALAAYVLFGKR